MKILENILLVLFTLSMFILVASRWEDLKIELIQDILCLAVITFTSLTLGAISETD